MRLGQLARKYGVSNKEIITYLKGIDPSLHSLGQNSKLDEQTVIRIAQQFDDPEGLFKKQDQSQAQDQVQEQEQIQEQEPSFAEASDGKQEQLPETKAAQPEKEGLSIETDKLLEMLESEDEPVDLSRITLIKAPKRELEGLKVVGKIDLPEPKPKVGKTGKGEKLNESRSGRHPKPLSDEEAEKRRLRAKKKNDEYQARQEKRRKEKEKKQRKAQNRARYQQKLERAKVSQIRPKHQTPKDEPTTVEEQPLPPRTLVGKLWRWFTTY